MALSFDKYAIVSIDSITGFGISTKECLFILDEIKDATLEGGAEIIWSTGKEGRRLSAMKRNKTCSISANNGFIVGGLLAQTIGDENPEEDFTSASIKMPAFERIEVGAGGVVETAFAATGTIGNEIGYVYKANKDGSQGQKFAQGAAASTTLFSYDPGDKEITLPTGAFNEGDVVIVFYEYLTKGRKYSNKSDNYAGDVYLVCDILVKDVCDGSVQHSKLVMPKVTLDDNFSYAFGNDMAVQAFRAEANSSICSKNREYFYWVFPEAE
jgi:hypothetical protein